MMKRCALWLLLVLPVIFSACGGSSDDDRKTTYGEKSFVKNEPLVVSSVAASSDTAESAAANTVEVVWGEAENPQNLFDHSTDNMFTAQTTRRIRVLLKNGSTVDRMNVFGEGKDILKVFRKDGNDLKEIPEWKVSHLEGLMWHTFDLDDECGAQELVLEITPDNTIAGTFREIEFWSKKEHVVESGFITTNLAEIQHYGDLDPYIANANSPVEKCSADVSEVTITQNSDANPSRIHFTVSRDPSRIIRAYIRYKAKNLYAPATLGKRINGHGYTGVASIQGKDSDKDVYKGFIEEIDPSWLVEGENLVELYTPLSDASIKDFECVYAYASGWNDVGAMTSRVLFDGDPATYVELGTDSRGIELPLERWIVPDQVLLHVTTPFEGTIAICAETSGGWSELPGCRIEGKKLVNGWNTFTATSAISASKLRIVCVEYPGDLPSGKELHVNEVRVKGSIIGGAHPDSEIVVSYPRNGEYYGRVASIRGFIKGDRPIGSNPRIALRGKSMTDLPHDGMFSIDVTKEDLGLSSQKDDDAWDIYLEGYDANGYVSKTVHCSENMLSTSTSTNTSGDGGTTDGTDSGGTSTTDGIQVVVDPDASKTIVYHDVSLTIPAGAVSQKTTVKIQALSKSDLKDLSPGMTNVTANASGYRFLPHGVFKKPVEVSFAYDPRSLNSEQKDEEVFMYYYNEKQERWDKLSRKSLEKTNSLVRSETDHFTDIINATLTVPEHPDALSFNPNSIKDIKAADPSAGINLIDAPQASDSGDASMGYSIEVPKGRGGLQPQVAVRYSSSGGNGWMGLGWDIPLSSVAIDTRFGVPRYDGTETYLLDGAQLVYVSGNEYRPRIEGGFRRIRYFKAENYWEVTDKGGVRYLYGSTADARMHEAIVYKSNEDHTAQWYLKQIIDPNGNAVNYTYTTRDNQVYLQAIAYTVYTINFDIDAVNVIPRKDVTSNCRYGFKTMLKYRLNGIRVSYNGQVIRRYAFTYTEGEFSKSLLAKIDQYGSRGGLFNSHSFDYYDDLRSSPTSGAMKGFGSETSWGDGESIFRSLILPLPVINLGTLSSSLGSSANAGGYFGLSPYGYNREISVGGTLSGEVSSEEQMSQLVDVNGDGLPDQFYVKSDIYGASGRQLCYKPNLGNGEFGSEKEISVQGSSDSIALGQDTSYTYSYGVNASVKVVSVGVSKSKGKATSRRYLSDVNGDGRVDLIYNEKVLYNHIDSSGNVSFKKTNPLGSIDAGNDTAASSGSSAEDVDSEDAEKYYKDDPIRMWRAPFSGTVVVSGTASLEQNPADLINNEDDPYTTADGVNVYVEQIRRATSFYNKCWSATLGDQNEDPVSLSAEMTGVTIAVNEGDEILFRVDSRQDGKGDAITWDPEIHYLDKDLSKLDHNNKEVYRYKASEDFSIAGQTLNFTTPISGTAAINGVVNKKATSDEIHVVLEHVTYREETDADNNPVTVEVGRTNEEISTIAKEEGEYTINYQGTFDKDDKYTLFFKTDVPIDWAKVGWRTEAITSNGVTKTVIRKPTLTFLSHTLEEGEDGDIEVKDEDGNYVFVLNIPVSMNTFPFQGDPKSTFATAPYTPYKVTRAGSARVGYYVRVLQNKPRYDMTTSPLPWLPGGPSDLYKDDAFLTYNESQYDWVADSCPADNQLKDGYSASVALEVRRTCNGETVSVDKVNGTIAGSDARGVFLIAQLNDLKEDEELSFICATDKYDLFSYAEISQPTLYYDIDRQPMMNSLLWVPYYDSNGSPHDVIYRGADSQYPWAGGSRSWFTGRWNGNTELGSGTVARIALPTFNANPSGDVSSIANSDDPEASNSGSTSGKANEQLKTYCFMYVNPDEDRWTGRDGDSWISGGRMSATRVGMKYVPPADYVAPELPEIVPGAAVKAVKRETNTSNISFNAGVSASDAGLGVGCTLTNSKTPQDFIDLNGDRLPDKLQSGSVLYTIPKIGYESARRSPGTGSTVRSYNSSSWNFNASYGSEGPKAEYPLHAGYGCPTDTRTISSQKKVSASAGCTKNHATKDFADVNGDGLPDMLIRESDGVYVRYNLGYAFTDSEKFTSNEDFHLVSSALLGLSSDVGQTMVETVMKSMGKSTRSGSYSVGMGGNFSITATEIAYIDMNGDGLPDLVKKDVSSDPPRIPNSKVKKWASKNGLDEPFTLNPAKMDNPITVRFNTGNGFGEAVRWNGGNDNVPLMMDIGVTQNTGGSFTVTIPIPIWPDPTLSIVINPNVGVTRNARKGSVVLEDIDGDGYVDQVSSLNLGKSSKTKVWQNQTGRTNLLKAVHRPLGSTIDLDYERSKGTVDAPGSRWLMKKVTVTDGLEGKTDGSSHTYSVSYSYENGYYDRSEREFYGFGKITETKQDGSTAERYFHNKGSVTDPNGFTSTDGYFMRGLETKTIIRGKDGEIGATTENTYELKKPITGNDAIRFPSLVMKVSKNYEGLTDDVNGECKTVTEAFEYDDTYGNVVKYTVDGDDYVEATLEYTKYIDSYIVGKPTMISVKDKDGKELRRRGGIYDTKGNIRQIIQYANGSQAQTDMTYDSFGNLTKITSPENQRGQRYSLTYTYDSVVNAYITGVSDSFGYSSRTEYDYSMGLPTFTKDINGSNMVYSYDEFGRTTSIYGPYDLGGGSPTISMQYVVRDDGSPSYAVTRNKVDPNSESVLETVVYIDGLKRAIQTKKQSEVDGVTGFTVSGKVLFDAMGREVATGQPIFETYSLSYNETGPKNPVTTEYDGLGRKVKMQAPDDEYGTLTTKMSYGFDENMSVTTMTDPKGRKKQTYKDAKGQTVMVKEYHDGEPIITRYTYDAVGQMLEVIDTDGHKTTCVYDQLGRRTSIDNPDTGLVEYAYDLAGNMTRKVTPNLRITGKSVQYVYNYNRLEKIDYPNMEDVYYTYGATGDANGGAGRVIAVDNGDVKVKRKYGKLGEMVEETKTIRITVPRLMEKSYTMKYEYDNLGRVRQMVYPDGEILRYGYDRGGLLKSATGVTNGTTFSYVKGITYDVYGQRTSETFGNGDVTTYEYFEKNRRLKILVTKNGATQYQHLTYAYDEVGNITKINNEDFITGDDKKKQSTQEYTYDDLDRLTAANGNYGKETWLPYYSSRLNKYTSGIEYANNGNILRKQQNNAGIYDDTGETKEFPKTTFDNTYEYSSSKPHAVTRAGNDVFTYDLNGNMLTRNNTETKEKLEFTWNDENRLTETRDNFYLTTYKYDDTGMRVTKKGQYGETVYVNPNYSIKDNVTESTHVFAGKTRIATKLKTTSTGTTSCTPQDLGVYYYHPDHLGSSSTVTDKSGKFYEHYESFPHGDVWVTEKSGDVELPYRFTGHEMDKETNLVYCGARYLDPKLGKFVSTDHPLERGEYFPVPLVDDKAKERNAKLPGMGGVFNTVNLNAYHYGGDNPIKFIDPDGNELSCGCSKDRKIDQFIEEVKAMAEENGLIFTKDELIALNEIKRHMINTKLADYSIVVYTIVDSINSIKGVSKGATEWSKNNVFDKADMIKSAKDGFAPDLFDLSKEVLSLNLGLIDNVRSEAEAMCSYSMYEAIDNYSEWQIHVDFWHTMFDKAEDMKSKINDRIYQLDKGKEK